MTGLVEWGQNSNPEKSQDLKFTPKNSHAEFPSLKNFQKALNDITRKIKFLKQVWLFFLFAELYGRDTPADTTMNLQIILNAQKLRSLLKSRNQKKKYLPKYSTPKIPELKILNPKKFSITPACVASVSVWFRSKKRSRNGIFGFGRARNETRGKK